MPQGGGYGGADVGQGGHYYWGGSSGIIPAALSANSEVFQFRWASSTKIAKVRKIIVSASVTTTMFAAGVPVEIALFKCNAWSAAGTGGTAVDIAAFNKADSQMSSSGQTSGDIRIATTAALGAGTKNLETNALTQIVAAGPITAILYGSILPVGTVLWEAKVSEGEAPLTLRLNEGFSIVSVAVPATGTWRLGVHVYWAEIVAPPT